MSYSDNENTDPAVKEIQSKIIHLEDANHIVEKMQSKITRLENRIQKNEKEIEQLKDIVSSLVLSIRHETTSENDDDLEMQYDDIDDRTNDQSKHNNITLNQNNDDDDE